jgi:two-component system, NarL family, response regulator
MSIRILLVDDHPAILSGLAAILSREPDFTIVGQARDGEQALALCASLTPDILLVDLHLPKIDGWTVIAQAKTPAIAISSRTGDEDIHRALAAGARGYLSKDADAEEFTSAVRTVARGKRYLPLSIAAALGERHDFEDLSERELDVLQELGTGASNKEIAGRLHVSESTIKQHIGNILSKLRADDRTSAVLIAIDRGLIRR